MRREEFSLFVGKTLGEVKLFTEFHVGAEIKKNLRFSWNIESDNEFKVGEDAITKSIVDKIYISENKIYPCVDLFVIDLNDYIEISGRIANYSPRKFQKGWSNRPGPFIYYVNEKLINVQFQTYDFQKKLFDHKLIFIEPNIFDFSK